MRVKGEKGDKETVYKARFVVLKEVESPFFVPTFLDRPAITQLPYNLYTYLYQHLLNILSRTSYLHPF